MVSLYTAKSESESQVIISGDSNVPGLGSANNNIIPLITNLQASLKAPPDWRQEPVGSLPLQQPQQPVVDSSASARTVETSNSLVKTTQPTCDNSRQQVTSLDSSNLEIFLTSLTTAGGRISRGGGVQERIQNSLENPGSEEKTTETFDARINEGRICKHSGISEAQTIS